MKSKAERWADELDQFGFALDSDRDVAAELRRLAAVDAERDSLKAELERIKALEPQQERGPMTTAQITDARKKDCFDPDDEPEPWSFRMGVVAAERHHKIRKD